MYSAQLWQLVKTWEMTQEFGLEGRGRDLFGAIADSRTWCNTVPGDAAPAAAHIPNGPAGVGGSGLTNEYLTSAWYELQIILNSGNHQHREREPVDWVYVIGGFLDLSCAVPPTGTGATAGGCDQGVAIVRSPARSRQPQAGLAAERQHRSPHHDQPGVGAHLQTAAGRGTPGSDHVDAGRMDGQEPGIPDHQAPAGRSAPAPVHSTRVLRRYKRREGMGVGKTV